VDDDHDYDDNDTKSPNGLLIRRQVGDLLKHFEEEITKKKKKKERKPF
jgi:hypothetical protein